MGIRGAKATGAERPPGAGSIPRARAAVNLRKRRGGGIEPEGGRRVACRETL